jgi:hypothetical protein
LVTIDCEIRKIYTGKLTYAANWDDFDKVPFWKELDYIGIDAYFPLSDAATTKWKSSIKLGSSTLQNGQTTSQDK